MLDKAYLAEVKAQHAAHASGRRELIKFASDAQSAAKRAIFALHRDDLEAADALFAEAEARLAQISERLGFRPELADEGSYRAALEEYAEAALYREYLRSGNVGKLAKEGIDYDTYLGALSDLTGELQRRQVRMATEGNLAAVKAIKEDLSGVVEAMLEMDLEGYLRNKFDQAKNSLRRAEDVLYEMTLRSKG